MLVSAASEFPATSVRPAISLSAEARSSWVRWDRASSSACKSLSPDCAAVPSSGAVPDSGCPAPLWADAARRCKIPVKMPAAAGRSFPAARYCALVSSGFSASSMEEG